MTLWRTVCDFTDLALVTMHKLRFSNLLICCWEAGCIFNVTLRHDVSQHCRLLQHCCFALGYIRLFCWASERTFSTAVGIYSFHVSFPSTVLLSVLGMTFISSLFFPLLIYAREKTFILTFTLLVDLQTSSSFKLQFILGINLFQILQKPFQS